MIDVDISPTDALLVSLQRCRTLHEHGRYVEALPLARACLLQAQALNDARLQFRALTALGHVLRASGEFMAALDILTEALTLADDADTRAKAWNNIGGIFMSGSAWALAIECFYKITTQRTLACTADAYNAHSNIALCYLYLDDVKNGLPEARQALRREPTDAADNQAHNYTLLRYAFVQLALKSSRVRRAEIQRRADEAAACAARHPNPRIAIWAALIAGSLQAAYGPRESGILQLEAALAQTLAVPELTTDALGSLVEAEKLAGRPARAKAYLRQWMSHLYQDAGWQATQKLGISDQPNTEYTLREKWRALALAGKKTSKWQLLHEAADTIEVEIPGIPRLSDQDSKILTLLAEGNRAKEIGPLLGISYKTVRNRLTPIYKALNAETKDEAVACYYRHCDEVATQIPSSTWYLQCLMNGKFEDAQRQWLYSPVASRPAEARLTICFILTLLQDYTKAEVEAEYLHGQEFSAFLLFKQWYAGEKSAKSLLFQSLSQTPQPSRHVLGIAIYRAFYDKRQYRAAADVLAQFCISRDFPLADMPARKCNLN